MISRGQRGIRRAGDLLRETAGRGRGSNRQEGPSAQDTGPTPPLGPGLVQGDLAVLARCQYGGGSREVAAGSLGTVLHAAGPPEGELAGCISTAPAAGAQSSPASTAGLWLRRHLNWKWRLHTRKCADYVTGASVDTVQKRIQQSPVPWGFGDRAGAGGTALSSASENSRARPGLTCPSGHTMKAQGERRSDRGGLGRSG